MVVPSEADEFSRGFNNFPVNCQRTAFHYLHATRSPRSGGVSIASLGPQTLSDSQVPGRTATGKWKRLGDSIKACYAFSFAIISVAHQLPLHSMSTHDQFKFSLAVPPQAAVDVEVPGFRRGFHVS